MLDQKSDYVLTTCGKNGSINHIIIAANSCMAIS